MADSCTPLTVLCVEDDSNLRLLIDLALRLDPAITVHQAGSSSEALNLWRAGLRPDLIMVDFRMPVLSGAAMLDQLRCETVGEVPPTVFCTATTSRLDHDAMKAAGAAGVIMKPFDPITLACRVRAFARLGSSGTSQG